MTRVEREALGEGAANESVPRSDLAIEFFLRADDEIGGHGQADRLVPGRPLAERVHTRASAEASAPAGMLASPNGHRQREKLLSNQSLDPQGLGAALRGEG
ncbi:MAG: hypothetical protein A3G27_17405 [Betaproteobacteria bacterium RIFCSPLOWO2_12_FULL_66_14]|nr:MAG: hypothetical protein A3G27_17405 [Betaproteobacteria bacterium RIFCSPLOWO2_12_FULL_66_14]